VLLGVWVSENSPIPQGGLIRLLASLKLSLQPAAAIGSSANDR
jgi:hypothetical protein